MTCSLIIYYTVALTCACIIAIIRIPGIADAVSVAVRIGWRAVAVHGATFSKRRPCNTAHMTPRHSHTTTADRGTYIIL